MTPANVTFSGGTQQLAGWILTAHDRAATALAAAQGAAAQGAGGFATWFGAPTPSPEVRVAASYGQAAAFLGEMSFAYDLDTTLPQLVAPDTYVVFAAPVEGVVDARIWDNLNALLGLDSASILPQVASSVAHEALVGCNAGVEDLTGVHDSQGAAALASFSPPDAARSALSYTSYLWQFIPTS